MRTILLALTLTATASALGAQAGTFRWDGSVPAGQAVEIRGVNGDVRAAPSGDGRVHVEAQRRGRDDDPASVRIQVVEHDGGVTICAVYPTPAGARRQNGCAPGGGHSSVRDNDVKVHFLIRVPRGVEFSGHTVNGDVVADGLDGDVKASTVNGGVDVRTTGFAEASSVNGDLALRLGSSSFSEAVEFETVNGSITIEMPEGLNADFRASTVNGSIDSDFPITVHGKVNPRSVNGVIGSGGPELRFSTVNGSIRLKRL